MQFCITILQFQSLKRMFLLSDHSSLKQKKADECFRKQSCFRKQLLCYINDNFQP